MIDLRDLEADRRLLTAPIAFRSELCAALAAALDEIARLKGLMVRKTKWGKYRNALSGEVYETEADAWAPGERRRWGNEPRR